MAENDFGKSLHFPVNRVGTGSVYCPPLKIHFPKLYRDVQTITRKQLIAMGLPNEQPTDHCVHYTIDEKAAIPARSNAGRSTGSSTQTKTPSSSATIRAWKTPRPTSPPP